MKCNEIFDTRDCISLTNHHSHLKYHKFPRSETQFFLFEFIFRRRSLCLKGRCMSCEFPTQFIEIALMGHPQVPSETNQISTTNREDQFDKKIIDS